MITKTKRQSKQKIIGVDPKNRMNDLDSKRWLSFQKSWFVTQAGDHPKKTASDFIEFFTKKVDTSQKKSRVGIFDLNKKTFAPVVKRLGRQAIVFDQALISPAPKNNFQSLDFALIDLRNVFVDEDSFHQFASEWLSRLYKLSRHLKPKGYVSIFIRNRDDNGRLLPIAWLFGREVGKFLTLKDEKIACETDLTIEGSLSTHYNSFHPSKENSNDSFSWKTEQNFFYCLNFRREEEEQTTSTDESPSFFANRLSLKPPHKFTANEAEKKPVSASWFVPKPPPREKNVLLHPAKFPESMVELFLNEFTKKGERFFDPMAGTGSAVLAALSFKREAYGIELSPQFYKIAKQRLQSFGLPLFENDQSTKRQLVNGDASDPSSYADLPKSFHYVLTSPPYWDMLRMKGAETQQKRKQAGLLQFYSDDERDVGNIEDYEKFLNSLVKIYQEVAKRLAAGRYMTIIVKNVKKKGKIYPLAWDLALRLSEDLILCHEQFWCQDDQRLAPFGYRYAWVSNTFHHYCLHFRKPE